MHIDKRFVYGPAQVNVNLDVVVEENSIMKSCTAECKKAFVNKKGIQIDV